MGDSKFPDKKVIRAPSLKRGRNEERITDRVSGKPSVLSTSSKRHPADEMMARNSSPVIEKEIVCPCQLRLEKVLGVTVTSNAALATDNNGTVAYPAGCTVVLLNTRTEQQNHIINTSRKTVTALSYSSCGRYIVTGECGHAPSVRIWDLHSEPQTGPNPGLAPQPPQVAELTGHKYGINCVAFSPCGKFVVSVGTQHDMIVNVWDWRTNVKVASNKVSTKVKAVSFAENGSYFVTVGNRHVKFWYLEYGKARYKEAMPLMGRSAILGEQRNNYFCDVACGKGECADSTFAITRSGLLCEFNNRRLLDKWVELRTTSASCIAVGSQYIFIGCSDSIVRCFSPSTLRFVTTLPRTHYLGVDVTAGVSIAHMASPPTDARYPDTVALAFDQINNKLTCIYNDHSVYVWDCNNVKRVGKAMSALYHSACIWGVEMPAGPEFPQGSFLTCGSDDTVRVWSLDKLNQRTAKGIYQPNVYSNELIKVIYVDPSLSYIKDMDLSCSGTEKQQQHNNPSQTEGGSYDGRNGVRCIRVSPDGRHLASGDRAGNIRIYDTATMRELLKVEAHDSEVLCLEYSCLSDGGRNLMASASRDRLLHVFDVDHGYQFLQTLDDHSSSITAVRFLTHPGSGMRMVSCGADKSLIFRSLSSSGGNGSGKPQFNRENHATGKTTLYDMEVDSGDKHVLTACQDRQVRVYSAASGKHTKSFKGSMGDEGTLIKVALDKSGIYLATSCTDKSLSVYDYYSGECMASVCGHSELATGLRFTNDCRRLVSASGDGCVFVWRVPHDMVVTMHARLGQQALRHGRQVDQEIFRDAASTISVTPTDELFDSAVTQDSNYRFSIGQLPQWAKKQLTTEEPDQPPSLAKGVAAPKGRWAQRAEHGVRSLYSQQAPFPSLPFPSLDRRLDSDGSKDSSLDSGMDVKQYGESKVTVKQTLSTSHRRSAAAANADVVDTGFESAAHDGDVESDTDSRPLYYPAPLDPPSSGGEFPVTNADADELRRSQRKRRPAPPSSLSLASPPPAASSPVSAGSPDSDDDDDASTPSGQGPAFLLSASVESLEQLGIRERYFQSTFDNMSGTEGGTPGNKSSISAQFLTRSGGERNTEAISAVLQTRMDPEVTRKRLELNKRIAETKRKLESVGMSSPLKYSQSIHDLSRIPDRDKRSHNKQAGNNCLHEGSDLPFTTNPSTDNPTNTWSASVPVDLQLSQMSLADLIRPRKLLLDRTLSKYKTHKSLPVSPVSEERRLADYASVSSGAARAAPPRKSFSYFLDIGDEETTGEGFKQICSDIRRFSKDAQLKIDRDFGGKCDGGGKSGNEVEAVEEEENFSSDSLEDYNYEVPACGRKPKRNRPPRRCVSDNEIYNYYEETFGAESTKSESFYLNQNIRTSQDSILSDDNQLDEQFSKSYCNSMESILSNESDCKSAPLEVLFTGRGESDGSLVHSTSLPKNMMGHCCEHSHQRAPMRTSQTQTDFETPEETVAKKSKANADFQQKILKFEASIAKADLGCQGARKQPIAFFVGTSGAAKVKNVNNRENVPVKDEDVKTKVGHEKKPCSVLTTKNNTEMCIPSLEMKNKQYRSKYCNVLNNRPEVNLEMMAETAGQRQEGARTTASNSLTLTTVNFDRNRNRSSSEVRETTSLDRHLFSKAPMRPERVCHKPPKAVRRHSSKRTRTTYEYVRKEDLSKTLNNNNRRLNNHSVGPEKTIEITFKEKNVEKDLENANRTSILNELYDSLDKPKLEQDSLEINLNTERDDACLYDSLEVDSKNVWKDGAPKGPPGGRFKWNNLPDDDGKVRHALENVKILAEIQRKVHRINTLVELLKANTGGGVGKVRALSSMYESLAQGPRVLVRRRNLSLPSFMERRLDLVVQAYLDVDAESPDSSLRRSCSLSNLSAQGPPALTVPKRRPEGKQNAPPKEQASCQQTRYAKGASSQISRSRSSTVLNYSDSESETHDKRLSRLMRPTISSYNKAAQSRPARQKHSYSTSNLNSVGVDNGSTSDDEDGAPRPAPRSRPVSFAEPPSNRNRTYRDSKVHCSPDQDRTLTGSYAETSAPLAPVPEARPRSSNMSAQLCEEVIEQLTTSAEGVVEMYQRLDGSDAAPAAAAPPVEERRGHLVRDLEMSIIRTHKLLNDCIFRKLKQNSDGGPDVNQTDAVKKLLDLVAKGGPCSVVSMMEQYSDILLDLVQQKMHHVNIP